MKGVFLFFLAFCISYNINASKCNHVDHNEIRYITNQKGLNVQYQEYLRNQFQWKEFLAIHGEWYTIFNEINQLPHRAFGEPILLDNVTNNHENILVFLSDNNFILPVDLRFSYKTTNDKHININFTQYFSELEVINSRLYAKITHDDELIVFGLDVFNDINISTIPSISENNAISSAAENITYPITKSNVENELKILPVPVNGKNEYHLVYTVYINTRIDEGPANYICYVDAHDGELLMRKNKVLYEAPPVQPIVSVSGDVLTTNPNNTSSIEKYKYLKAVDQISNTNYYTDSNGDVNLSLSNGTSVRYKLEGLYADVQTNNTTPDIYSNIGSSSTILFDNSNSTMQERTAYWAVNEIHDHMKNIFPTFTGLDFPMETNIDETGSCNAFYTAGTINFYEQGGGCHATAKIPDVVYHEYGHAINDYRYGQNGMWNGGLNEGFADVWAISLTETPVLGFGWDLIDPTIFVRRYDQNRKVYPQDLSGEVHADGEIIAGCFWDTYLNLGSMQQMLDLFKYTFDGAPDGPNGTEGIIYTDILIEVLYADDNDANIQNGTPNDLAIVQAFALHGITLLSNAVISHNPISNSIANSDIAINANISSVYSWTLDSLSAHCYYRLNDATSWNDLPMSLSGSGNNRSVQVNIPGQLDGNIIAYYIFFTDVYGYETGITPMAANIMPIRNANLPYFILVGYQLTQQEDFDFNFGVWQTGDQDDNASTGLWEIGEPIPSYDDPGSQSGIVQTDSDHTVGGTYCAFTQNASSIMDGIGANDVDDGHTTLLSPYYDLSNYSNPAFSYYRWYTNSPPSGANPGADWWQVLISGDGVNWEYVENNKSSEIAWREFAFRVKDYINLTNQVQLKFIASDSIRIGQNLDGGSLVEAAVDDLSLYDAVGSGGPSNISDLVYDNARLIRITDILGREVDINTVTREITLFYIYDNGNVEKRLLLR